jgi:phosphoribosyl 1,2-cyclic phosphodiesterase
MKFSILRSGSSGNCTLIDHNCCKILIDAGMSQKRIKEALEEVDLDPTEISAIVVTHLHSDHCNYSTLQICRKFGIELFVHDKNVVPLRSVLQKDRFSDDLKIKTFNDQVFQIGTLVFKPFDISHDAYVVTSGFNVSPESSDEIYLSYAADLGVFPDELICYFQNAKTIVLESNHDTELLWNNPRRPYIHKKRVAGEKGHLSNRQSADALIKIAQVSTRKPDNVVLCHLSKDHNSPQKALESVSAMLEEQNIELVLHVARRDQRTPFFEII